MVLPSLSAYFDLCKLHDWGYALSMDNDAAERGRKSHDRLTKIYKQGGSPYIKVYTAWKNHYVHGEPEPARLSSILVEGNQK